MKLNKGPIEVPYTPELMDALFELMERPDGPEVCIETGTYLGTGSTLALVYAWAWAALDASRGFEIYTMEGNSRFHSQACKNLAPWPWVHCLHMLSVGRAEAVKFIENDPLLTGEMDYPDICKDIEGDLVGFYRQELSPPSVPQNIQQDGLAYFINRFKNENKMLFVLDSAGGIGFLEFLLVTHTMGKTPFFVWLDDKIHLKHYRSWLMINENLEDRWKILFSDNRTVLAERLHG